MDPQLRIACAHWTTGLEPLAPQAAIAVRCLPCLGHFCNLSVQSLATAPAQLAPPQSSSSSRVSSPSHLLHLGQLSSSSSARALVRHYLTDLEPYNLHQLATFTTPSQSNLAISPNPNPRGHMSRETKWTRIHRVRHKWGRYGRLYGIRASSPRRERLLRPYGSDSLSQACGRLSLCAFPRPGPAQSRSLPHPTHPFRL